MASPARSAGCWRACGSVSAASRSPTRGNIIGLKQGDAAISLEPAGQLELSGAPLETLHDTMAELEAHYDQVRSVSRDLQIGFAPLGFHPTATREQMPWMPKGRYAIMRRYMPKVGERAAST